MKVSGKIIQYNSKEFKAIFERLFPSMCILASNILKSDGKGKDIAQEAFVKLWEKDKEDFTDENSLKAYLYVLVRNACISQLRKEKKLSRTTLDEAYILVEKEFLNEVLREETYNLLHEAIKELSPQSQQVVNLTLKGYRNQDIAEELNISINTVKTVKKRAYKLLREKLGNQFVSALFASFFHFF